MKKVYEITGKSKIKGTIKIQGSKNSALAIIVASLLCKDIVFLENVPRIKDVFELLAILKKINVKYSFVENTLMIDSSTITYEKLLFDEVKQFRASYYFIGVFIALFKKVEIYLPGGCNIGHRPIDQHIKGLSALGVEINIKDDIFIASCNNILGKDIFLDIPSVGATINILLASVASLTPVIIKNAAREPEIVDLINFLNSMNANIVGQGSGVVSIYPIKELKKTSYCIMPDRIVAGTYLLYGALLAEKLTLTNIVTKDIYSLINTLINLGVEMDIKKDSITVYKVESFSHTNIKTGVFPEFPSDLQQILSVFLLSGEGVSFVEESIFENRFLFLKEIEKMDGRYFVFDNKAVIIPSKLKASNVKVKDLRGGAALLLACMCASGTSTIEDVFYIERGYENLIKVLQSVNVDIKEIEVYEA